jgi:hypothetical protein
MNTISRTLVALAAFAAVSLGNSASAAAVHCKPDVEVTNKKGASIKVLTFKYKIAGNPNAFTEGLANKRLARNEKEEWPSQTLNNAANGVVITSSAVEFQNDNSGSGGGYGPRQTSAWHPHSFECGGNHTYKHTVD